MMKILVPDTGEISAGELTGHEVVRYTAGEPVPAEHADAEVITVWGTPLEVLRETARRLRRVQLVQGLAAGPDELLAAGFRPEALICSGVGLHSRPVAEHATALLLAMTRQLPAAARRQSERRWDPELGGRQPLHPQDRVTTLLDARVLIWGFGAIGQRLATVLSALGAHVTGVARHRGERSGYPVVTPEDLPQRLPDIDVLIVILPRSGTTQKIVDRRVLDALPRRALLVNVGRGSTVDEAALADALASGSIAQAAIDVTAQEPLPADSPLWSTPHLFITPHMAGGRPVGATALLRDNVIALREGEEPANLIRRSGT